MQIELVYHKYYEGMTGFENTRLKRKWDILVLVEEGEHTIFFTESKKKIDLHKDEIALIPAGVEFEREVNSPLTCYYIFFLCQAEHCFHIACKGGVIRLPSEQTRAIFNTAKRAFMLPDNRELITHMVEHILAESYLFGKNEKAKNKPFSEEIQSAIRYMRRNLHQKIDMDELAELVFLSHSGLIWKFRQELNTTPQNYLKLLRLRYAKQLLLNESYTVTKISEMCGYSSPYYFTNAFRKYSGMSPTAFRKHYQG